MDNSIDEDSEGVKNSKVNKRIRNVSEWDREKRKRLRVAGKEYVNTKGELIRPRKIGADCKCRRKCYTKVNEEEREVIFDDYYAMKSHDEQNAHLFHLIRKHKIARRRSKGSEKRTCTFRYYVRLKNAKEIHICRLAFCHIHAVSAHKVRLLCEKLDRNVSYPRDERGRHGNRPTRISEDIIRAIKEHVLDILRSDKLRDFMKDDKQAKNQIASDINITKMWRDFLKEHKTASSDDKSGEEWSETSVKLWLYNKVFHSVVSKEISDTLRKKISEIKNEIGGETASYEIKRLSSSQRNESASSQTQNVVTVPPAYTSVQNSFLFQCGVAGTLDISNAQYYR